MEIIILSMESNNSITWPIFDIIPRVGELIYLTEDQKNMLKVDDNGLEIVYIQYDFLADEITLSCKSTNKE